MLKDAAKRPLGSEKGFDRINQLGEQNDHHKFQVPQNSGTVPYRAILGVGVGVPLHKPCIQLI